MKETLQQELQNLIDTTQSGNNPLPSILSIEKAIWIISQLPTTADGVPIVPDMMIYCIVGQHVDERKVIGPYGKLALLTSEPARHGAGGGSSHRLADVCYSTRAAAEASK